MTNIKYVASQFNLVIKEDAGKVLVFNTFSGCVCTLEKDVFNSICNNIIDEKWPYFNDLISQGIIVIKEIDQVGMILQHENLAKFSNDKKNLSFVIAPTLKCNLRCYYCFESSQNDCKVMDEATMQDVLKFIENSFGQETESLRINWFGGEPLLAKDFIIKFSKEIKKITDKHNVKYTSSMITNGVFLTKETAKNLKQIGELQSVQITLDGSKDEYCKRKGTTPVVFEKVIQNICDCADIVRISIRLNCDGSNYNDILNIVDDLFTNHHLTKKIGVYLAPITDYNGNGFDVCNNKEFSKLLIKFNQHLKTTYPDYPLKLDELNAKKCYCALKKCINYAIGPNGELYTCEHDFGVKEFIIGDVKNGEYFTDYHRKFLELKLSEKCKKCKLLPLCLGGCPSMRYNQKKDVCCITEPYVKYIILNKINKSN